MAYLYKMQRFTKNVIKEAVKTRLLFTKYGCVLQSAAIFFTYFLTLIFSMRLKKAGRLAINFWVYYHSSPVPLEILIIIYYSIVDLLRLYVT